MSEIKLSVGDKIRVKFDFSGAGPDDDEAPRYIPGGEYPTIDDIRETNFVWVVNRIDLSAILCSPAHMPGALDYVIYRNEVLPFNEDRRRVI